MDCEMKTILANMGFSKIRIDTALAVTSYLGVEPALNWLLAHSDELDARERESSPSETNPVPRTSADNVRSDSLIRGTFCQSQLRRSDLVDQKNETCHNMLAGVSAKSHSSSEKFLKNNDGLLSENSKTKCCSGGSPVVSKQKTNTASVNNVVLKQFGRKGDVKQKAIDEKVLNTSTSATNSGDERTSGNSADDFDEEKSTENSEIDNEYVLDSSEAEGNELVSKSEEKMNLKKPIEETKSIKIQIKFSDGSTFSRMFDINDYLSSVRQFAQECSDLPDCFGFCMNFPKTVFTREQRDSKLWELGLTTSTVLFIHDTERDFKAGTHDEEKRLERERIRKAKETREKYVEECEKMMEEERKYKKGVLDAVKHDKMVRLLRKHKKY